MSASAKALLARPCIAMALLAASGTAAAQDDATLRQELEQLRNRLDELEALRERVWELEQQLQRREDTETKKAATSEDTPDDGADSIEVVGAVRFNYAWDDFSDGLKTRRGDAGLDLFRIGVEGQRDNFLVSAEYRFYPYMNTIHHGWVGYDFGDAGQVQAGITQVPFGLLPYAAHNYWFGVPYYLGLADDYDAGVKYEIARGPWNLQTAFFKNEELGDAGNLDRYSFDPVTVGPDRNQESNTVNARLAYTAGLNTDCTHELGVSGQWGELYNVDTGDTGEHWAAAAHLDSHCGRWNVQFEVGRYEYDPRNPAGVADDTVTLGAFAGSYPVAANGTFGVANVAYNVPVKWPKVDIVTCYSDFSVLRKDDSTFDNSYLHTIGCGIGMGPVFTYIDWIRARNMVYFGDGSLAGGGDADGWDNRFNINVGYYW